MATELQNFLRENGPDALIKTFGVYYKQHPKYPNLYQFTYDQIEADAHKAHPVVRQSRGIILDKDNDWGVVARPFDRFFNVGEACAAPVDWKTSRVQEKVDGCFPRTAPISLWGGGTITMGEIVNGARPTIMGMDEEGNIVPSKIVAAQNNGTKDNWLKIKFKPEGNSFRSMRVTSNHSIFINGEFQLAALAKEGDRLTSFVDEPSDSIVHFVKSGLIGDGFLSANGNSFKYSEGHMEQHSEYVDEISRWLGSFSTKSDVRISGFGTKMFRAASKVWNGFSQIRKEFYEDGDDTMSRRLPEDLSWVDNFTIAKWYMDDGSLQHSEKQNDRAVFSTNRFPKHEVERLAQKLNEMYGVNAVVFENRGWTIRVNAGRDNAIYKFWSSIAPHIVPCMKYKLPEEFRSVEYVPYPTGETKLVKQDRVIASVEHMDLTPKNFPHGRSGFDIQTTTSNYFANGVLVHNSLCIVCHHDNQWHVATKGTPDASGNVNGFSFTFAELFWDIAKKQGVKSWLEDYAERDTTYLFELTSIFNKVVVRYPEPKLTLIGARDLYGREKHTCLFNLPHIKTIVNPVKEYSFSSQEEMVEFAKNINGTEGEGFVVVDDNFNRIKVKSDNYIALSHMKDGFGPRRAMEIVRKAEGDEVQVYIDAFPEFKSLFDETRSKYNDLLNRLKDSYECIKHIENQKEFAILAVQTKLSGALFNVRKGTTTFEKYLAEMNIKHLVEVCGMKYDVEANDELV
jgi:hypothetical protein